MAKEKFNQDEYIKQYNKDNYKHYHIKINLKDTEVLNKLESQVNKNNYIVELIRKDIQNDRS